MGDCFGNVDAKFEELEKKLTSLAETLSLMSPPAPPTHPPSTMGVEPPPQPPPTMATTSPTQCKHNPGLRLQGPPPNGQVETDLSYWISHLESTLYQDDTKKSNALWSALRPVWHHFETTTCRTKANRFYMLRCRACNEIAYGEYGHNNTAEEKGAAKEALLQFLGVPSPSQSEDWGSWGSWGSAASSSTSFTAMGQGSTPSV